VYKRQVRSLLPPKQEGEAVPLGDFQVPAGAERERYLEASALTPAAQALVARAAMDAGAREDTDRAGALLALFRDSGRWRYSLEVEWMSSISGDPVSAFITDEKCRTGHCVLFASAFVLSCRALGIPSRLVAGLAGGEYDASRDEYVFRNRDAHAWAEAFLAGRGWMRFDPTPDVGRIGPPALPPARALAGDGELPPAMPGERPVEPRGWLARSWDFFLGYDAAAQSALLDKAMGKLGAVLGAGSGRRWGASIGYWITAAAIAAVAGAMLAAYRLIGRGRASGGVVSRMHPRHRAALRFYGELLAMLAGRGMWRGPSQTPSEFAAAVSRRMTAIAAPVAEVTRIFERARYGGVVPGPDDEQRLKAAMEEIARAIRAETEARRQA
ncbi:MAG: transglutaminase domain-containing protein, partial [Planctomycetota bacterium]|nr:transglutaminase domain-containing protein [Planctomycetota bacterium]